MIGPFSNLLMCKMRSPDTAFPTVLLVMVDAAFSASSVQQC